MRILAILTSALLISGCANLDAEPATLTSNVLLRASNGWDGTPYMRYPDGQPELSLLRIQIPAATSLEWHCHLAPNMGYLVKGEIEVETLDGKRTRVRAGEPLAEIVNRVHRGHTSEQPAELLVFYAGAAGIAPATPASECPTGSVVQ
ncbi:cupin domain-containing protein [Pseudomonas sp. TWI628]|uniref:cupin domain-containing protein n=1 Tax=Pseudomonas sp. TWI628 TaxID=3136788 RepID=UPI00320ADEDF